MLCKPAWHLWAVAVPVLTGPCPRPPTPCTRQDYITGRDFALSVVGCARLKHVDGYLDKVLQAVLLYVYCRLYCFMCTCMYC